MNQFWLMTKSATAALFLVGLGTSYAQAEIRGAIESHVGDDAYNETYSYDYDYEQYWDEQQVLESCPSESSELTYETAPEAAVELASDPAIANDIETLPSATTAVADADPSQPLAANCWEVAETGTLDATVVEPDLYATDDYYYDAEYADSGDWSSATAAPAPVAPVPESEVAYPVESPAPSVSADSLAAAPQWQGVEPAPVEQQPVAVAPAAAIAPEPSLPPTTAAPSPDEVEPTETVLLEDDPQFRAWLERDSEAAQAVEPVTAKSLIRGDRTYRDLIAARKQPAPVAARPAAPAPAAAIASEAEPAAVAEADANVTPLLATLEADLQRIRQQARRVPAPSAAPLLQFQPENLVPSVPRPTFALPSLPLPPETALQTPAFNFDPQAVPPLPESFAFRAPDLSFLKSDAFERDRYGLRLALFNAPSDNELLATDFLAGNPLFDGTLNAMLAEFAAESPSAFAALPSPTADWQLLTNSLELLAAPEQAIALPAGEGLGFGLPAAEDLLGSDLDLEPVLADPAALLSEPADLELEFSLPLEPLAPLSPLSTTFQPEVAPARTVRDD